MRPLVAIREFLALESAGGILLAAAALAAMLFANSPLERFYAAFLETPVEVRAGGFEIAKPLLLWINEGLMAVFFFLVGLELKREAQEGELSRPAQIALPAVAALGGMAVPAAIHAALNWGDPVTLQGWAIPTATDIAFALGVLSLLGERVPTGLKVFLLTLAILDDLGAIVIIAIFYSADLSGASLGVAACALAALALLRWRGVRGIAPYLLVGLVLWASVLKSGVHATLAGAVLALFIPRHAAQRLERDLHPPVAYGILPLFAFANAGVPLAGVAPAALLGVSALCGVGFTMSLFIAGLAFEASGAEYVLQTRLGILSGSLLSALAGYAILWLSLARQPA